MQIASVKTVLILSNVWCEPSSSAAGVHMGQILEFLIEKEYKIFYASTSNVSENRKEFFYANYSEKQIPLNDSSVDSWFKEINPDLVIFDRFNAEEQFGWRIRSICPTALLILNTEDLHSLRKSRQEALKQKIPFTNDFWKTQEITLREIASVFRCDATLVVSKFEEQALLEVFGVQQHLIHYLPITQVVLTHESLRFSDRQNFVTIGNFMHEPNVDSIKWLKNEIWPMIRAELPKTEFHIYGSYPNTKVMALNDPKSGFLIKGKAQNVIETLAKYRVCLAPLRFGAGIKGKFLDAMQCGLPSITTSVGIEAMGEKENWGGLVSEFAQTLAQDATRLYNDEALWSEKQLLGYNLLTQNFNGKDAWRNFEKLINLTPQELITLRHNNFIGSMLQQHSNNSTKYFSKWIEAKNK